MSIGFWIVNDDPSTVSTNVSRVFAPGGLKYLDKLINEWAVKYNLAVMISLHAHQGSQNGFDNSAAQEFGKTLWSNSTENVENSLQFATFIAARYQHSEAFLGLNLMSEPSGTTPYEILLPYYEEAYKRIRATGNDWIIVVSPKLDQQNPPYMADYMRPPEYNNVFHEYHPYYQWIYAGRNETQIIDVARQYRSRNLDPWTGNPLYMGEWSLGSPKSAPFKDRSLQKVFAEVQLQNYEAATAGWSFWSWKNDEEFNTTVNGGIIRGWSMRQLLKEGIFKVPRV